MVTEPGIVGTDPGYGVPNGACDPRSSALRRGRGSPFTTTEAECARQFSNQEVAFGLGLGGPLLVPARARLIEVVVDLSKAPAVGLLGARVDDLARVAESRVP
jgi:hypothetical protein